MKQDWLDNFVREATKIIGVDCSALTGLASQLREQGRQVGRDEAVDYIEEHRTFYDDVKTIDIIHGDARDAKTHE
jgi:hypothetical protein